MLIALKFESSISPQAYQMLISVLIKYFKPQFCEKAFRYQDLIATIGLNPLQTSACFASLSPASLFQAYARLNFSQLYWGVASFKTQTQLIICLYSSSLIPKLNLLTSPLVLIDFWNCLLCFTIFSKLHFSRLKFFYWVLWFTPSFTTYQCEIRTQSLLNFHIHIHYCKDRFYDCLIHYLFLKS